MTTAADDLLAFAAGRRFGTVLADPPWRFQNRTGKVAPEHRRLSRYETMSLDEIAALPVAELAAEPAHLYLWVPNALLAEGLAVMAAWGFTYKTTLVWHKVRKDGGSDGRGVGFYFRNVTESVLFGVRGRNARTLAPGRRQTNLIASRKREHSRKPDELYPIIEACSRGPFLELFARPAVPAGRAGGTRWIGPSCRSRPSDQDGQRRRSRRTTQTITVHIPFAIRKRGGRKLVVTPDGAEWAPRPRVDNAMVKALARAFRWRKMLDEGVHATLEDLARAKGVHATYVSRVLRLTLLAPEIVEAILDGRQPAELQLDDLLAGFPLDVGWAEHVPTGAVTRRPPLYHRKDRGSSRRCAEAGHPSGPARGRGVVNRRPAPPP